MEDKEIIYLYLKRKEEAILETSKKYGGYIYSIVINVLQNEEDANEAIQDTYLAIWDNIKEEKLTDFKLYVGIIARTKAINILRKNESTKRIPIEKCISVDSLDNILPSNLTIVDYVEENELINAINNFLLTIDKRNQTIFKSLYFNNIPKEIVMKNFNLSEKRIQSIIYDIKNKLYLYLVEQGYTI